MSFVDALTEGLTRHALASSNALDLIDFLRCETMIRLIFGWSLLAIVIGLLALYGYGVSQGDFPPPDPEKIKAFGETAVKSSGALAVVCVVVLAFLAAIAPFVYVVRSGDGLTVLFAFVALVLVVALLVSSRTIIDMVLAAIVYFTSAMVSVVVFSMARVTEAIRGGAGPLASLERTTSRLDPLPPTRSLSREDYR